MGGYLGGGLLGTVPKSWGGGTANAYVPQYFENTILFWKHKIYDNVSAQLLRVCVVCRRVQSTQSMFQNFKTMKWQTKKVMRIFG